MASDELAKLLHDKLTRGESLTAEEQAILDQWYTLEDSSEGSLLRMSATNGTPAGLQAQVDAAIKQLATVTKRIQEIAAENEALRRDTAELRRQLASMQPA